MGHDTAGSRAVDPFIAARPEGVRPLLDAVRATVRAAAPEAEEKLSCGIPTFGQGGNPVSFGVGKRHLGHYPTPGAIAAFAEALAPYSQSQDALPHDLIARIVRLRVAEQAGQATAKRSKGTGTGIS